MSITADQLVQQHIIYCVSTLFTALTELSSNTPHQAWESAFCESIDSVYDWHSVNNWESAANEWLDDTPVLDLEDAADSVGYWSDWLASNDIVSLSDYLEANPEQEVRLKTSAVTYIKDQCGNWREFCSDMRIDCEGHTLEVYEHWVVTDWLASKLRGHDEVVFEFAGLTVWGRTTTGQSVSMDYVIERVAAEVSACNTQ